MKQYVRWLQVQQRLIEHYQATGTEYSFCEAMMELWEEGRFQCGPELPPVEFLCWDGADLGQLGELLDHVPVNLDILFQEPRRGVIPTNIAPLRIARYQATGIHIHDFFEINYVACGTAKLICGGTAQVLPAGSLCMISPQFPHDSVAGNDCLLLSAMLSAQDIEDTLFRLLRQESLLSDFFRFGFRDPHNGCILFSQLDSRAVLSLFRGLLHEFYNGGDYFRDACANYLELLFIYLLRQDGRRFGMAGTDKMRKTPPILAILKHIQINYRTASLNEVAARFHYEPSYLGKQIKLHTGKNFGRLVNDLRIAEAKRLLLSTDLSAEKVAALSGFNSAVHFSRSFRDAVGVPPVAWRKAQTKNTENVNTTKQIV